MTPRNEVCPAPESSPAWAAKRQQHRGVQYPGPGSTVVKRYCAGVCELHDSITSQPFPQPNPRFPVLGWGSDKSHRGEKNIWPELRTGPQRDKHGSRRSAGDLGWPVGLRSEMGLEVRDEEVSDENHERNSRKRNSPAGFEDG